MKTTDQPGANPPAFAYCSRNGAWIRPGLATGLLALSHLIYSLAPPQNVPQVAGWLYPIAIILGLAFTAWASGAARTRSAPVVRGLCALLMLFTGVETLGWLA